MTLMDDKQNAYRRYAENIFSGGNELVDPEHRIDTDEMINWVLREQTTKTEELNGKDTTFFLDLMQIRRNTHTTFSIPSQEMF